MDNKNIVEKASTGVGEAEDLWILDVVATTVSSLYTGENKKDSRDSRAKGNRLVTRKSGDGFACVSIAGVMRAMAEQIYKGEGACDVGEEPKGCGRCIICDGFGSLGRKGRYIIDELKSTLPFEKVVDVAVHPRIDRNTGTLPANEYGKPVKGASLEVEEIVEGTELTGRIFIRRPKPRDIEIIESALAACGEQGVGGWNKRSKGRLRIETKLNKVKWDVYKKKGQEEAKRLLG